MPEPSRPNSTATGGSATPNPKTPDRNPFVGPRPFEREDADLFFGRAGEVQELVSLVFANRVLLLYATSGAGKTSLLNAGVLPLLERDEHFQLLPTARFLRTDVTVRSVRNIYVYATLQNWGSDVPPSAAEPSAVDRQPEDRTLAAFLASIPRAKDKRGRLRPRTLVFDQFEEIFTVYPEHWEQRDDFFDQLSEALEEDRQLRIVLSLREDYLAQLDPWLPLLPTYVPYRLERLTRDDAIEAVTRPVAEAGRHFGAGVAERLVEDLLTLRIDVGGAKPLEVSGEFVEPVQLQVACRSLWSDLPRDASEITGEHLHTFGDVNQVLARFYDEAVGKAAVSAQLKEKQLRRWIEDAFITSGGTRSTVYRTPESTSEIPNVAIDELENRHLIRAEWRAGARWYELTHDRLIEPIEESNAHFRAQLARRQRRRASGGVGVLGALVAAALLTWLAIGGGGAHNAVQLASAKFIVSTDFVPNNPSGSDAVSVRCTKGGIPDQSPKTATEARSAVFTITGFGAGATCSASLRTAPAGYATNESECRDLAITKGRPSRCIITNSTTLATLIVHVHFADGNTTVVPVALICARGTVDRATLGASEASPAVFTVTGSPTEKVCTATEKPPNGYTADESGCKAVPLISEGSCTIVNVPPG